MYFRTGFQRVQCDVKSFPMLFCTEPQHIRPRSLPDAMFSQQLCVWHYVRPWLWSGHIHGHIEAAAGNALYDGRFHLCDDGILVHLSLSVQQIQVRVGSDAAGYAWACRAWGHWYGTTDPERENYVAAEPAGAFCVFHSRVKLVIPCISFYFNKLKNFSIQLHSSST